MLKAFLKIDSTDLQKNHRIFDKVKNENYKEFTDEMNKLTKVLPIFIFS